MGRREILDRLCEAVEASSRGRGAHFWISGPHGIGKSRLVEEIGRYAALRGVPFHPVATEGDFPRTPADTGVLVVDPLDRARLGGWISLVRRAAANGSLCLVTTTSAAHCRAEGISDREIIALRGLVSDEAVRLLSAWLGPSIDLDWARRTADATRGNPGRMKRAAERMLRQPGDERPRRRARPTRPAPRIG